MCQKEGKMKLIRRTVASFLGVIIVSWFYQPTFFVSKTKPTVALVFGYNIFLKDDAHTKAYVRQIIPYLQGLNLQAVIVSGGVTRPTERPGQSEADALRSELMAQGVKVLIICEQQAHSTVDNVRLTKAYLEKINHSQVVVFSSPAHRLKIAPIELWFGIRLWGRFHFGVNPWTRS